MNNKGNDYDNKKQKLTKIKQSKKTYHKPQLQVYGDLREITQTFAMAGKMDGGTGQTDKTHA
jgi:hypothetical protein